MSEIRRASCNEHIYMDMQDLTNSYAIQFLFRIRRLERKDKLEEAINTVIKNNKGSNVFLKGKKYYLNEEYVKIDEISDNQEDILNLKLFQSKIDYTKESFTAHIINNNGNQYLCFRFLHSVMDGKGCLLFVENVMNCLKRMDLVQCSNNITEKDFIEKLEFNRNRENKLPIIKHPEAQVIDKYVTRWRILELEGYVPSVIAKTACVLNAEFEDSLVKYMIPTDIRRHNKEENFLGNLTLPIFLKVKDEDTYQNVNGQLLYAIKNKEELNLKHASFMNYAGLSKRMRKLFLKPGIRLISKYNKFSVGAIISHLGRIDLENYGNDVLEVDEFFSLPIQQPLGAFSVVIVEYNHKTKLELSYYEGQFSEEYIDELCVKLKNALSDYTCVMKQTATKNDSNFIALLERSFAANRNGVAVDDGNRKYTYAELKENVNRYVSFFRAQDLKRQDKVVLYLDRGFEYISAVIACVASAMVFVPIDKTVTPERLDAVIKLSNCRMIISDKQTPQLEKYNISIPDRIKEKGGLSEVKFDYKEDDVLYQIYTSGTTGVPKCVPIRNRNLNNYILWANKTYRTLGKLVMPLFTSLSVDLTITSTFLPLLSGGTIKTYKDMFSAGLLKKIFRDSEINVIKATPTHLSFLADCKEITDKEIMIVGGEQLTVNLCEKITSLLGEKCKIVNEYGPAEATVGCIYALYGGNCGKVVPIGQPISNTKAIIYDGKVIEEENISGELLIAGDSVFEGYPDTDNDCFVRINDERYYKTGDVVYRKNKELYYVERLDNQVKIRGNRVELDEIKSAICQMPGIEDCAVLYKGHIYAYVITVIETTAEEIKRKLREKLPNYMIPYDIFFPECLPVLPSGKMDKNALISMIDVKKEQEESKYHDEVSCLLASLKPGLIIDKNETLFRLGLESFDVINFIQILVENYIDKENEEAFVMSLIDNINMISIKDIEKEIAKFGRKK